MSWNFPTLRVVMVSLAVSMLSIIFCRDASAEKIKYFDTEIRVQKDSTVHVTESILYDYEHVDRYGFNRYIPLSFSTSSGNHSVDFRFLNVTEGDGRILKSKVTMHDDAVTVTIGDPKIPISGRHVYRIEYELRHGVNYVEGVPEFDWNVTGAECPVPIERALVKLYPPPGTKPGEVSKKAFIGTPTDTNVTITVDNSFVKYLAESLNPGDEFVISAAFPKGSVTPPTVLREFIFWLSDWWPSILLPLLTGFGVWVVWWHYGRDAYNPEAIPTSWDPPTDISPAEVGTLYDERCDMQDIIATLFDLAARGHLKIKDTSQPEFVEYHFIKTVAPSDDQELRNYERNFLQALFDSSGERRLSELRDNFYLNIPQLKDQVYEALAQEGYFHQNPENVRKQCTGLALFFCFVGMFLILASSAEFALAPFGTGLVASAAIIGTFAFAMPARTEKGVHALRRALGFARFVNGVKSKLVDVLSKADPSIFGRLLPYALVLGVADKWAENFHGTLHSPPSWFETNNGDEFSPDKFVLALGSGMRQMESVMTSVPPGGLKLQLQGEQRDED